MAGNRCVVYVEPGKVSVENIDYPKLELPPDVPGRNRKCEHGVILKVVATNICGSDQHMVRGRTTAPRGQTLGHEITGEIIELGSDVQFLEKGDLISVPSGYHGALTAGVTTGSTVYIAGAGPVGLACAAACQLLGAAVTIVGDMNPDRLDRHVVSAVRLLTSGRMPHYLI